MTIRSILFAALLPASLVACGGGGDSTIVPAGAHTHYVVNKVNVPTNNTQSRDDGLDLNGDKTVDNQLGMVLGTLAGQGIMVQASVDTAVNNGEINLLVDVQTTDFTNAAAAGFSVYLGDNPSPAACSSTTDTVCGNQLKGGASFGIDPASPTDAALAGKFIGGTFSGGGPTANLDLQISLGGTSPVPLSLIGARVQASGVTATAIGAVILAGAITQDDLNNHVLPAVHDNVLLPILKKDCPNAVATPGPNGPPTCGCADGSGGKQVIALLDTMPADCTITLDEIKNNGLFSSLLAPDVTIEGMPALSLGLAATAVSATFTPPGQ
jgi:hypothetical protein